MQPTYLPWAGYLRLIARADCFVYLDDAQYERGTWHQRNRVLVNGSAHWLTVPVRAKLGDRLHEVRTDDSAAWRRKHLALIEQNYGRHPFAAEALALARRVADRTDLSVLADLNILLIEHCCEKLGMATRRYRASEMGIEGARTQRVIAICESLGATSYLSPPGARDYLEQDGFRGLTDIHLEFDEFMPLPYPQRGVGEFVSHLSSLDVVANVGWTGLERYIATHVQPAS